MKFVESYLTSYLTILLFLCLICSLNHTKVKSKTNLKSSISSKAKSSIAISTSDEPGFSGFFWKQLFEPGKDPEIFIKKADRFNEYEYLRVDAESLKFTPDKMQLNNVYNQLYLHDIYDPDKDNLSEGKCCSRITYYEYPERKCFGRECIIERQRKRLQPQTQDQLDRDPLIANYCINIFIYQQVSWRICHRDKNQILKLKNVVTFGVLKTIPGAEPSEILEKYIQHTTNSPLMPPDSWNWHNVDNWGESCKTEVMQSPINVIAPVPGVNGQTALDVKVLYKFNKKIPLEITLNGVEIVMKFKGYSGAFKIVYREDGTMLSFTPVMISFRFPAEHLINGFRTDGEIVITCNEITPLNNMAYSVTNGMEFVIPVNFHPSAPEYKEFSVLNPEMWRHELEEDDDKIYKPREALTGRYATFDLHSFMTKVMDLKGDFSMYLGSQTTPPCKEHVLQIVTNRPLLMANCQFKDLRENTLLSTLTRETHARPIQTNHHGGINVIKNLKFAQFEFRSNLHQLTPERKFFTLNYQAGKNALRKKILLFRNGRNCGLEKTVQIPQFDTTS